MRTIDDLRPLEERFKRPLDGPIVIDCYVNPDVRFESVGIVVKKEQEETEVVAT